VLLTAVAATALHKWAEIILIPESQTQCYGAIFHTRESVCLGILKDKKCIKGVCNSKKGGFRRQWVWGLENPFI